MKRIVALAIGLALILSMMVVPALADYTPVTPADSTFTHTLTLTDDATALNYTITYHFTVDDVTVVKPSDIHTVASAVTGKPAIADITYNTSSTFIGTPHPVATTLQAIDWSGVTIKEPGIYRWQVAKEKTVDGTPGQKATNLSSTLYLWAYATDNGGTLQVSTTGITSVMALNDDSGNAKGPYNDNYPENKVALTLTKTVGGSMGSKDQYFKFTIRLKAPSGTAPLQYDISGAPTYELSVPATAYHSAQTNPDKVEVRSDTPSNLVVWLKHGQGITINGLPVGTDYTIIESENLNYTVSATVSGDITGVTNNAGTSSGVSDSGLSENATVAYKNEKDVSTPTGINVQVGAPVMGILLVAGLMLIVVIGKRRKEQENY